MPIQVVAAIVGVALTSCLALFVYYYRSTVTYEITSLHGKFKFENNEIVASSDWNGKDLCMERIKIVNNGFIDVDNFVFHLEHTRKLINKEVTQTTTLGKSVWNINELDNTLVVETPSLPRGESCVIEIAYQGFGGGREYLEARGAGRKYRLERQSAYSNKSRGFGQGLLFVAGTLAIIQLINQLISKA